MNKILSVLVLSTACTNQELSFPERKYFGKIVTMQTPSQWKELSRPIMRMHDPHDTILTSFIGKSKEHSVLLKIRQQPFVPIQSVSTNIILDKYYKSSTRARFLAFNTDTLENKIVIDYLAPYNDNKKIFYFRSILFVRHGKWISFDFQGEDSKGFRDTTRQITSSIKINVK